MRMTKKTLSVQVLNTGSYILGKYFNFGPVQKVPHGCPKWADTKVTSQCPKRKGVGGGRGFFSDVFPKHKSQG